MSTHSVSTHRFCTGCGQVDGPVVKMPTRPEKNGKCRCGGDVKEINYPPSLPDMTTSDWVIVIDENGEKFPAVYDHANEVWRRNSYPNEIAAYMWVVARNIVRWRVL